MMPYTCHRPYSHPGSMITTAKFPAALKTRMLHNTAPHLSVHRKGPVVERCGGNRVLRAKNLLIYGVRSLIQCLRLSVIALHGKP